MNTQPTKRANKAGEKSPAAAVNTGRFATGPNRMGPLIVVALFVFSACGTEGPTGPTRYIDPDSVACMWPQGPAYKLPGNWQMRTGHELFDGKAYTGWKPTQSAIYGDSLGIWVSIYGEKQPLDGWKISAHLLRTGPDGWRGHYVLTFTPGNWHADFDTLTMWRK